MTSHTSTSPSTPPTAPLMADHRNVVLAFCLDNQPHIEALAHTLNLSLSTLLGILAEPQAQTHFDQLTQAVAKRDALITHRLRQAAQLVLFDKLTGNTSNHTNLDSLVPLATSILRSTKPIIHKAAPPRFPAPNQPPIPPDPFTPLPREADAREAAEPEKAGPEEAGPEEAGPAPTIERPTLPAPAAAAIIAPAPSATPTNAPISTPISAPASSTQATPAPTPQSATTPPLVRSSPASILAHAAGQLPRQTAKEPPHPRPESACAA